MIGASANSYVYGSITKLGDDDFTFHVGEGRWAPVVLEGNTEGETFTVSYTGSIYSDTTTTGGLKNVSRVEYWDITDGGLVGGNDVDLTLHWKDQSASGIDDAADLVVAHFNGADWEDFGQTAIDFSDPGFIKTTGVSSFSPFTFGSKSSTVNPLPVELQKFEAVAVGGSVQLAWTTLSESQNDYFVVERSLDGIHFTETHIIEGGGSTMNVREYAALDQSPPSGTFYYRLKQVDFDGASTYSQVVRVVLDQGLKVEVFPNPISQGLLNLYLVGVDAEEITILLFDAVGTAVLNHKLALQGGQITASMQIDHNLKPGVYFLVGRSKGEMFRKKVVLQ